MLCLGDSLIKHGLIPGVIEEGTGRRTVNLSAARAPALLTYFLLRRALDAGARPRAIIINAKPAVLLAGPEFNARYWQEVLTPRECLEFSLMTSNGPFMLATIVGRLLPSLRSRLEIQSNVLAALRGETDSHSGDQSRLLRNWTVNGGANVAAASRFRQDEAEPEIERRCTQASFSSTDPMPRESSGLIRLADERATIPVFWLFRRYRPLFKPAATRAAPRRATTSSSAPSSVRYPRLLTVLDARRGRYPASLFTDHTHLNGPGAIALSRAVASAISPFLARPRSETAPVWIALSSPPISPACPASRARGPRAIEGGSPFE